MQDMKYEEKEIKDFSMPQPADTAKYPHGLRISLGKEELKKLGIQDIPKVGEEIKIEAIVEVVEVSSEAEGGDERSHRVSLQIKEMEVNNKKELKEQEEQLESYQVLYGE